MEVVIEKATLKRHRACTAAYTSPEWDEKRQALVYTWPTSAHRLLATIEGTDQLEWLVRHKLVPMTPEEFETAKSARGGSNE